MGRDVQLYLLKSLMRVRLHKILTKLSLPNPQMATKLDMVNAYDSIEWEFAKTMLLSMGFPNSLVERIAKCITTVSCQILINGQPSQKFYLKYLGQPVMFGKSKKYILSFVQERVWNKINGWRKKCLSQA